MRSFMPCLLSMQEMKFSKELCARLKTRLLKKKKKKGSSDEMAIEKVVAKVVEEWIELAPL